MITIETLEYYFPPEYFAVVGGFFVFVFLFWYNEVDILIANYHQKDVITNRTHQDVYKSTTPEGITIAEQFTKGQIAEFQEAFALFDRKGDGTIRVEELPTLLRALGLDRQKDRYEAMMSKFKADKNGMLDFQQFLKVMEPVLEETDMEGDLLKAFQLFDKDKNGFISVATMRYLLSDLDQKLTEEEIDAILGMADIDNNGMIDYKKFIERMNSKAYGPRKRRQKDERKQKAKRSHEKQGIRKRNRRASYSF